MYTQLSFFDDEKTDITLSVLRGWQGNALSFIERVDKRVEKGEDEKTVLLDELRDIRRWVESTIEDLK
jgi:hypothetical protein